MRLIHRWLLTMFVTLALVLPSLGQESKNVSAAERAARDVLGKFDKAQPDWKERMSALVNLAKHGPATVPVLVEALKNGSPPARELAAQALVPFAEPGIRTALEHAVGDPEAGVRIYAIHGLSMLGPLPPTEQYRTMLDKDPSQWGVKPMLWAAMARDDQPNPPALRQKLANYDLRHMDTARLAQLAPDFSLPDFGGTMQRLSRFRGQTVVVRFILFDF
jgi:HEAT repeat protein